MRLNSYFYLPLAFSLLLISLNSEALPEPTYHESGSSTNVNMGYGGLKWTLGESYVPEIVGGYRYASVTSSGATQGADISIAFKVTGKTDLANLIQLGKLRAKYLNGMDYLQGEVGGGWDFAKKGLFAGISAQGPYSNTGVDYDFASKSTFGKSLSPYIEFNSIGIYNTPAKIVTSPPAQIQAQAAAQQAAQQAAAAAAQAAEQAAAQAAQQAAAAAFGPL